MQFFSHDGFDLAFLDRQPASGHVGIRAVTEHDADDIELVRPLGGERGDDRGKSGVVVVVGIRTRFEQSRDERDRTPVDGIFQRMAETQLERHAAVCA